MKKPSTRRLRHIQLAVSYGNCLEWISKLEKLLRQKPRIVQIDIVGSGEVPADAALRNYRGEFVADAKAVVVGLTSNGFTIADPNDRGMLDVVGFDTSAPAVIADFVRN